MNRFSDQFLSSVRSAWPWLILLALSVVLQIGRPAFPQIVTYPGNWTLPLAGWINVVMDWFVAHTQAGFRMMSAAMGWLLSGAHGLLLGLPWVVLVALFTLIAWQGGGRRLAVMTVVGLLYILVSGYWHEAMTTLSLVFVALPLAVLTGFTFGYLGYRSEAARRVIMPVLDLMQTIPAFAYLIPILLLFGFGPVVGLISSVIFAIPPMVRNTMLGFDQIPPAILESARMSGCSRRQQFAWAELPSAWPQMLLGVNQTTMAALSMVIIAAIIGGFDDVGWAVLSAMRKAQFGQSLVSGLVIVVLAIVLDRITAAYASRQLPTASFVGLPGARLALVILAAIVIGVLAGRLVPGFRDWPQALVYSPAQSINESVTGFTIAYGNVMDNIKNAMLYYVLLPVKLGFERAIVPFTWGVSFTPSARIAYWLVAVGGCVAAFGTGWWRFGVAILVVAGVLYFGVTGLPWVSVLALTTLVAYRVGGRPLAMLAGASVIFLLITGLWPQAMLSVYLCFVAVLFCILFGGLIAIWSASSDAVSSVVRPINDMLQTLPQFVLLIPALMLFQVGDFTALLAIIAYAIVPMIRYTEYGLRSVPATMIDAGVSSGCSGWQLFWQVRLPLAIPQILIGINQTVLYALGMLVIAALVGTTGLGQAIYVALGVANAGAGMIAGLGMALIAMTVDRILQAVVRAQA